MVLFLLLEDEEEVAVLCKVDFSWMEPSLEYLGLDSSCDGSCRPIAFSGSDIVAMLSAVRFLVML